MVIMVFRCKHGVRLGVVGQILLDGTGCPISSDASFIMFLFLLLSQCPEELVG